MRKWSAGAAAFFMAALWIVSGCGGDSSTKTAALHSPMKVLTGHTAGVNAVAYSPDGSLLASGAASVNNSIRLWDPQTGEHLRTLKGRLNGVHSLAFSPDSKTLASGGSDNSIRLWDPQTGDLKRTLNCGAQCSESLAFSPDGETLAVGIADGIQLWNAETGELNRTIQTDGAAVVEFSSDGKTAIGAYGSAVSLWSVETGEKTGGAAAHRAGGERLRIKESSNTTIYALANQIWAYQADGMKTIFGTSNCRSRLALSPDGSLIARVDDMDGAVILWDLHAVKRRATLRAHEEAKELSFAFSPDGKTLASGGKDNAVRIWDMNDLPPAAADARQTAPEEWSPEVRAYPLSPHGD